MVRAGDMGHSHSKGLLWLQQPHASLKTQGFRMWVPLPPALPGAARRSVVGDNDRPENLRNIKKGFSDLYACTVSCKYFQNLQEAAQRDQGGGGSR